MTLKYVESFIDRYGKRRFYYRRFKDVSRIVLPDIGCSENPSAAFLKAYERALNNGRYSEEERHKLSAEMAADEVKRLSGFVYVLEFRGWIKIGFSFHPAKRIMNLQVGIPQTAKLLHVMPGTRKTERNLHNRFRHHREHGEWFRRDGSVNRWVVSLGRREIA
jgi:hypothetical protein